MSTLFYLSTEQIARIKPYFPLSHGVPRVDDEWDCPRHQERPAMEKCLT